MLQKLQISNYAIIDGLEVDFTKGLNIITGETGAGKSILVGALGLVLGDRAESGVLYDKQRKCIVEATFLVERNHPSNDFLERNEIDRDPELIIRREITSNGKSRSFINDTPATLSQLKDLSALLVDLHQQFDNADAGRSSFQRSVLDVFARNKGLLGELYLKFTEFSSCKKELNKLESERAEALKEQDYNRFLYDELETLSLKPNELEDLDAELKLLANAENIRTSLQEACHYFSESDEPIILQVKQVLSRLQNSEEVFPRVAELRKRLESSFIELKDISGELEIAKDAVVFDPRRLEEVNERIASGYRLQKKHGVTSTAELIAIKEGLEVKLQKIESVSEKSERLRKQVSIMEEDCMKLSEKIGKGRIKALPVLEEKVNELLKKVGMPNAKFRVKIIDSPLTEYGTGTVVFLFNANYVAGKDHGFEPLQKVASGGELSRVMLILKSLVAKEVSLPTLIFDEIDTGISGEASRQVATIMKELAHAHQVISVTHQPQIAARADSHFYVFKKPGNDRIITSVSRLTDDERVEAIAQMLGGDNPSATTISNAREMVKG